MIMYCLFPFPVDRMASEPRVHKLLPSASPSFSPPSSYTAQVRVGKLILNIIIYSS